MVDQVARLDPPGSSQAAGGNSRTSSSPPHAWYDFSEDEFNDVNVLYLGGGVYDLGNGSLHAIGELPDRANEPFSPPNRPDTTILPEIPQSPVPVLLEPRISPELAVQNAQEAAEDVDEIDYSAIADLIDQAAVYYHNTVVSSRRAQRAEA
jgi:hypothetical protein